MAADPPPAAPGPRPAAPPVGMLATGAHVGAVAWWCEQVFAAAGRWVPATPEAPARAHLAELSRTAGEVALALRPHLPRPAPVDPEAWVAPPWPGAEALLGALDDAATGERLAGLHRALLPRLLVAVDALVRAGGEHDRALARRAGHARSDLVALWLEGEALLEAHLAAAGTGAGGPIDAALVAGGGVVPTAPHQVPGTEGA